MERRSFIKNTALFAVAVTATGFIRFDGSRYVGDCETTTDILGPFYRPDSPVRSNLTMKGEPGTFIQLKGSVKHKDCITPCKKAAVELWHCSSKGEYDNTSKEFRYRGTTYTDEQGHYLFNTILPVPYEVGEGIVRPAHFHMMITAKGYQPLVTQLYFSGDPHISTDAFASSPHAIKRILNIQTLTNGTKKVLFDVSISDKLTVDPAAIDKLTGIYTDENDKSNKTEFFKMNNALWMKNEVFGVNFEYIGNNSFQFPGVSPGMNFTLQFEIMPSGLVKLTKRSTDGNGEKKTSIALKEK